MAGVKEPEVVRTEHVGEMAGVRAPEVVGTEAWGNWRV